MVLYGYASDAMDEYLYIGEITTYLCLEILDGIIYLFEDVNL